MTHNWFFYHRKLIVNQVSLKLDISKFQILFYWSSERQNYVWKSTHYSTIFQVVRDSNNLPTLWNLNNKTNFELLFKKWCNFAKVLLRNLRYLWTFFQPTIPLYFIIWLLTKKTLLICEKQVRLNKLPC